MNGRIGHLHTQFRLLGQESANAGLLADQLQKVIADRLAEMVAAALAQAAGDNDAVYVLRHVAAPVTLVWKTEMPETHLAQQWGAQIAGSVMRHIAQDEDTGKNLMRFDNQAQFVAKFTQALLNGRAWDRWFFGAFLPYRDSSVSKTLQNVLLDNKPHLPAILRYLHQANKLEQMLAMLDEAAQQALWLQALGIVSLLNDDSLQPVWITASKLVTQLGLWGTSATTMDTLRQQYLASHPFMTDWRDRRGLATAVFDIIQFFTDQGCLKRPSSDENAFSAKLLQAVNELDWLDNVWLQKALFVLLAQPTRLSTPRYQPVRQVATPRQQQLLQDLMTVLHQNQLALDMKRPDSHANGLRLYSSLVTMSPNWIDDPMATHLIARLLHAVRVMKMAGVSTNMLQPLRQGDTNSALALTPESSQPQMAILYRQLVTLGNLALDIVEMLLSDVPFGVQSEQIVDNGRSPTTPHLSSRATKWLPTAYAGVFLLLRAVLDARLPALVAETDWPGTGTIQPLPALIASLAQRWGGSNTEGTDDGLALIAGVTPPLDVADLVVNFQNAPTAAFTGFQTSLLRQLASHRLLQPEQMILYQLPFNGHRALIATDASTSLYALSSILPPNVPASDVVTDWLTVWQQVTGHMPTVITSATAAKDEAMATAYASGNALLQGTFESLENGRLGLPEADLTIALCAAALLRLWARWLRQFSASSPAYLLRELIRRPGSYKVDRDILIIRLAPKPLDMVLHMAGYTASLAHVSWLPYRQVVFQSGDP